MMYIHVPMEEYTVNFYTVARLVFYDSIVNPCRYGYM